MIVVKEMSLEPVLNRKKNIMNTLFKDINYEKTLVEYVDASDNTLKLNSRCVNKASTPKKSFNYIIGDCSNEDNAEIDDESGEPELYSKYGALLLEINEPSFVDNDIDKIILNLKKEIDNINFQIIEYTEYLQRLYSDSNHITTTGNDKTFSCVDNDDSDVLTTEFNDLLKDYIDIIDKYSL